jgi:hypothetical protein
MSEVLEPDAFSYKCQSWQEGRPSSAVCDSSCSRILTISTLAEQESTPFQTCSALAAMIDLDGSTTKPQISHRSIKKASASSDESISSGHTAATGKYLLEREKLVKENAWKLDQ